MQFISVFLDTTKNADFQQKDAAELKECVM